MSHDDSSRSSMSFLLFRLCLLHSKKFILCFVNSHLVEIYSDSKTMSVSEVAPVLRLQFIWNHFSVEDLRDAQWFVVLLLYTVHYNQYIVTPDQTEVPIP